MLSLLVAAAGVDPLSAEADRGVAAKIDDELAALLATQGVGEFIVYFAERAEFDESGRVEDWAARGTAVVDALERTAERSQADVVAELDADGTPYDSYWAVNAIHVRAGDRKLADTIALDPHVAAIEPNTVRPGPAPTPGTQQATIDAVEWNIATIGADDVWSDLGSRGEGIVVANIDSGVQFDHPALVNQYRGNRGNGVFDHDYSWFDPTGICGPSPCDNNDHGTHTMGTMAGDDGLGNSIGVAPGARWIAAKGCEDSGCSDSALLASGQWILAPTRVDGTGADPARRPHVVNNSWGGSGNDPWYDAIVDAWVAAGIFPAFSIGNGGSACNTDGSPGDYSGSYASGAFDVNGTIAGFSSRGPGRNQEVKPDIAAPGVDVRSAVAGNGYAAFDGTSMASPHTAATVALMWSVGPSLLGAVAETRAILDQTAVDVDATICGGDTDDNNVFGQGRLDARAAAGSAAEPRGSVSGRVTDAVTGEPVAFAGISVTGPIVRTVDADADGRYAVVLPVGAYDIEASSFGYGSASTSAVVTDGNDATRDLSLQPLPTGDVSGLVTGGGTVLDGATVAVVGAPIPPATTVGGGAYELTALPFGSHDLRVSYPLCYVTTTVTIEVTGPTAADIALPAGEDGFGYTCSVGAAPYVEADDPVALTGDDVVTAVTLPFAFPLYDFSSSTAHMSTNGYLGLQDSSAAFRNGPIPSSSAPNGAVYPFWDDLLFDGTSEAATSSTGSAPDRRFLVEWRNAGRYNDSSSRVDVQVELRENGVIEMRYRGIDAAPIERGASATVGIENADGTVAFPLSVDEALLDDSRSLRLTPPGARTTPSLAFSTQARVQLGGSVTDTVVVDGRSDPQPGSTVRFALFGPGDPDCLSPLFVDTLVVPAEETFAVTSAPFTPTVAGTHQWVATFSGDAANHAVAGACGDPDQLVDVVATIQRAVLVAGSDRPPVGDSGVESILRSMGLEVVVIDDDTPDLDVAVMATDPDVVLVSSTVVLSKIGSVLRDLPVPVVSWEAYLSDDFAFTAAPNRNGETSAQTSIDISAPGHPIAAGLDGRVRVTAGARRQSYLIPTGDGVVIARSAERLGRPVIAAWDSGDALATGPAPARRVALFLNYDASRVLTPEGELIVEAAVSWALGGEPGPPVNRPPTVDAGPDAAVTLPQTTVSLSGTVDDDGLPVPPGTLVVVWRQAGGPDGVTFAPVDQPTTTATFPGSGEYVLELVADDGTGEVVDTVQVTVREPGDGVVLVAGSTTLIGGDAVIHARMLAAGLDVTIVDDDDLTGLDINGFDAAFVSTSVAVAKVVDAFTPATIPVVTWEAWLLDDLGLGRPGETPTTFTTITIVDPTSALAAGRFGSPRVYRAANKLTYATVGQAADVVAHVPGQSFRATVFSYDRGDVLYDGSIAAGDRYVIFPDYFGSNSLTPTGLAIVDAVIEAATG